MAMTRDEIRRDRAVIAAASPTGDKWGGVYGDGQSGVLISTGPMVAAPTQAAMDADFIRQARDRWVLALDEIDRLRAER